jgi:hypothetical protein
MTKYIRFDKVAFVNNGRADLTIMAKKQIVSSKPFSYALTIADARKDGVPVKILMDPNFAKRSICKYGGLSVLVGGISTGIWSCVQLNQDRHRLSELQDTRVIDEKSNLVVNQLADWDKTESNKNRDTGFAVASFILAFTGCVGISFSFTF